MTKQQFVDFSTSLVKTFAAAFIGQVIASGIGVLDMGAGEWRTALAAAIAAALSVLYSWLSPYDTRFGVGADA